MVAATLSSAVTLAEPKLALPFKYSTSICCNDAENMDKGKAWRGAARDAQEKIGNKYAIFRTLAVEGVAIPDVPNASRVYLIKPQLKGSLPTYHSSFQ